MRHQHDSTSRGFAGGQVGTTAGEPPQLFKENEMAVKQHLQIIAAFAFFVGAEASAHTPPWSEASRTALLEAARRARLETSAPPSRKTVEKGITKVDDAMAFLGKVQRGWHGVGLAGGDFPAGAGFNYGVGFTDNAVGAVYEDLDMPNRIDLNFVAATSTRSYHQLSGDALLHNIGGSVLNFAARGKWYEHPEEDFFGLGPGSAEDDRSDYLQRGLEFGGDLWLEPLRGLRFGGGAAWMDPRIGSGEDPRFPSTDELFNPSTIPGFENPPEFVRLGGSVSFDWRDGPLRPRAGGFYGVKLSNFKDQDTGQFDFRQYELDAQQYIPWLNRFRVLALRANVVISDADDGTDVPFFPCPISAVATPTGFPGVPVSRSEQPAADRGVPLGGLVGAGDGSLCDVGKVAAERKDLDFHDLEASYGFGFRFHSTKAVSFRLDLAFSREGFIPFLRYTHVF
ncbi:BamA/TamA family outer membrane protein [bacterium]|nr:BamA/TamA family outer membrane protein [bacterium]